MRYKKLMLYLKEGPSAESILEKTTKELRNRNKIIRIADKYGWDVVEEYMDDPITDDNEEATKLRQAAYRAKLKRNTHQQKNRNNPYTKPRHDEYAETQSKQLFREPSSAPGRELQKSEKFNTRQKVGFTAKKKILK
jgi:hypothetical protein